jgi:hypothetical protein
MDAAAWQPAQLDGGPIRLANPARGFRVTTFDDGALRLQTEPSGAESLRVVAPGDSVDATLRTVAWGRAGSPMPWAPAPPRVGGCDGSGRRDDRGDCLRRLEIGSGAAGGLLESWRSDERGLEQGWEIAEAPPGDGPILIDVAVAGVEIDVDSNSYEAMFRSGTARLRYAGLRAEDARGEELSAWLEAWTEGLRIRVDDGGARYPLVVDPVLGPAAWSVQGNQAGALLGSRFAGVGDVNGDG